MNILTTIFKNRPAKQPVVANEIAATVLIDLNNLSSAIEKINGESVNPKKELTYDDSGNLISIKVYSLSNTPVLLQTTTFSYSDGSIIRKTIKDKNNKTTSSSTYKYDGSGNLTNITTY